MSPGGPAALWAVRRWRYLEGVLFVATLLGWMGGAAAAESVCAARIDPSAWITTLTQAESAFAELNQAGFETLLAAASQDLRCLSAPVSPEVAARYHRLIGLDEFVRRDEERARLAFAAARAVDPLGALPSALLPPGHVARALSESASSPGAVTELWLPHEHTFWFDGVAGTARPADRDTLLQVEAEGALTISAHLTPSDPLPRGVQARATHRKLVWLASGLGLALGGAAVGVIVAGS